MNNAGTLYWFEVRKLVCRRVTLIVLSVMLLLTAAITGGEYLIGKETVNHAGEAIIGRRMDDTLLTEMRDALEISSTVDGEGNLLLTSVNIKDPVYDQLFNFLIRLTGNKSKAYVLTGEKLETIFNGVVEDAMEKQQLTAQEKDYWTARRQGKETLPPYGTEAGWGNILVMLYLVNFFSLLAIGTTLSGAFAEEYQLGTDALILSTRNGSKRLCPVKLAAGLTVGMGEMALILGLYTAIQFAIYGGGDGETSVQFFYGPSGLDMSARRAVLLCVGILLLTGMFYSTFVLCLSQLFRNSAIPTALSVLLLILSMFNVPEKYRLLSQLAAYFPATFPGSWSFTDYRLMTLPGIRLNYLQMQPIVVVLAAMLLSVVLCRSYSNRQK